MTFSIFTYNTLFNYAIENLKPILEKYKPDILCLQEVNTDEANLKNIENMGLKLADYGNSFVRKGVFYGVATFYNPKKFRHVSSTVLYPGSNLIEVIFTLIQVILGYKKPKAFLKTHLEDRSTKRAVNICNVHLYVVGSNALRVRHVKQILNLIGTTNPLILTGDFNYFPYQRRLLENSMKKNGLIEATKNITQTISFAKNDTYSFFQKFSIKLFGRVLKNLKIDYIFYRQLKLVDTKRVEVRFSDHFPIISRFDF